MSVFTSLWNFQAFYPGTLKPRQVRGTLPLVYWGSHWWWITSFLLDLNLEWESELTKHQEQYCSSTAASWRLMSCTHSLPLSLPVPGVWPLEQCRLLFWTDISMSGRGLRFFFHLVFRWDAWGTGCDSGAVLFDLRCGSSRRKRGSCSFPFIICYPAWIPAGSLMIYRDSYGNGNLWWHQKLVVGVRDTWALAGELWKGF